VIFNLWFAVLGGALMIAGMVGWALEPPDDVDTPHDEHHDGDPSDDAPAEPVDSSVDEATDGETNDEAEATSATEEPANV
ncbi:MAG: cytochrome ubiquinol oxidase subunit I, partial [Microthrixaceae bacterium]|nr:cytochrome ubiquinol oxidase subunit I [Microthrixaceae bacterium]